MGAKPKALYYYDKGVGDTCFTRYIFPISTLRRPEIEMLIEGRATFYYDADNKNIVADIKTSSKLTAYLNLKVKSISQEM